MPDFMLLMHNDSTAPVRDEAWGPYLAALGEVGRLRGGSALGGGGCVRKDGTPPAITHHLTGFIRIEADSLDAAKALLNGNPVYEAGGTIEVWELPRTD